MPSERKRVGRDRRLRALGLVCLVAALSCLAAAPAEGSFGFKHLGLAFSDEAGFPATQAGSHPFAWTTSLAFNTTGSGEEELPEQAVKDLRIALPPGLVGSAAQLPRCSRADFLANACPGATVVGEIELHTDLTEPEPEVLPLYNLEPLPGAVAELGLTAVVLPLAIRLTIDSQPPHNLVATIPDAPQAKPFYGAVLKVLGAPGGVPFLTLPRTCAGPLTVNFEADSWDAPGIWVSTSAEAGDDSEPPSPVGTDGCDRLAFHPTLAASPTTTATASPSGLDLSLSAPDPGLTGPGGIAHADLRGATFTLPAGMTVNASVASGLLACGPAEFARESLAGEPGEGCPDASKLGTAEVRSPLLEEPVDGSIFLARPNDPATGRAGAENPFDSLLALYVVFRDPKLGLLVKQPAEVVADAATGRLTVTLDDIPELPFSELDLHFRDGPRAPLVTPPGCGADEIQYSLEPSSGAPVLSGQAAFSLDRGCAAPGFRPTIAAGTTRPLAGATSPFSLSLSRGDGEQNPSRLSLTLPKGLSADFGSVALCPEGLAITGACPDDSRIGSVQVVAGAGPLPTRIPAEGGEPGAVFLGGAYEGAPFSLTILVPGRAGPFDLGAVVTRAAVFLDPRTGQATIQLDPLPQILSGIPIAYRTVALTLDRPGFIRNPTSCAATAVHGTVVSATGTVAHVSSRFEVGDCRALGFKPKLAVRLLGPARRGAHPGFRTVLTPRQGDANTRDLAITLPGTELLDSRHIGAVCTRAQFAVNQCPRASIYGYAKAWSPLLHRPLRGPVYLRASDHPLPDLAVSLSGQIHLELSGRIDTAGGRIRDTFAALPDVPLSKVVLTMAGGKRGLLVNTGGLCARKPRVSAAFAGQNGKRHDVSPILRTDCGKSR
jgi:hypothetical protein